jgi:hypothetical protein
MDDNNKLPENYREAFLLYPHPTSPKGGGHHHTALAFLKIFTLAFYILSNSAY